MSRRTQKNVGVIGLGIIGRRVADNLRRRGFHVFVWNRTPRPYPNFVGSPFEIAELCDFVQIFVSDDAALMDMVEQMKRSLSPQHVIMAHSTVAPHTMRKAAEIVQRRGAHFLDAPFTGSKVPAEKGELVYYVAGDDGAFRRARNVLEASSKEIIEIGEIGQATTVKIATNMVTAATVQAAAEALAIVHNAGLAPEKFMAAMSGNASNSATLAMKLPKMVQADFDPHFSVKHMLKDVQIAARLARSYGLTLGATEAARDSLLREANSGHADADFSSLIRALFPDGLPSEQAAETAEEEAQARLNGVEEEAAAQPARDELPLAAAQEERRLDPEADEPREKLELEQQRQAEGENQGEARGDTIPEARAEEVEAAREETTSDKADDEKTASSSESVEVEVAVAETRDVAPETAEPPKENEPETRATEAERPDAVAATPEAATPEAATPEAATPEAATPEAATTSGPTIDEPTVDEPTERRDDVADVAASSESATRAEAESQRESVQQLLERIRALAQLREREAQARAERAEEDRKETLAFQDRTPPELPATDVEAINEERLVGVPEEPDREPVEAAVPDEPEAEPIPERETTADETPSHPSAAAVEEPSEPVGYTLMGEPPRERRIAEEPATATAERPRDKDDTATARRGFLSRMFGKGPDY